MHCRLQTGHCFRDWTGQSFHSVWGHNRQHLDARTAKQNSSNMFRFRVVKTTVLVVSYVFFALSGDSESLGFQRQFSLVLVTPQCDTNSELTSIFIYDFVSTVTGKPNTLKLVTQSKHVLNTAIYVAISLEFFRSSASLRKPLHNFKRRSHLWIAATQIRKVST